MLPRSRLRRLEQRLPAVEPSQGFFVVGTEEYAEALLRRYRSAGQDEPRMFITGISREHALWIPDDHLPGADEAMAALSEDELLALLSIVREQRQARHDACFRTAG